MNENSSYERDYQMQGEIRDDQHMHLPVIQNHMSKTSYLTSSNRVGGEEEIDDEAES